MNISHKSSRSDKMLRLQGEKKGQTEPNELTRREKRGKKRRGAVAGFIYFSYEGWEEPPTSTQQKMENWLRKLKNPAPPSPGFQVLPPEITTMIIRYLCAPDMICFSLSCKYALACVQSLLGCHKLRFCQTFDCVVFDCGGNAYSLLIRLEKDTGLRFCGWGSKLHPFSLRRALRDILNLREEPCCSVRELDGYTLPDP